MVPLLEGHMGQGKITPVDYEVFEAVGFQALLDAMTLFESGGAKKKLVVQLQQD
jgi:hypothetical protein